MARPFKLNDLQLILLSTAAQRDDGSLLPPPASIGQPASRIRKVIAPLIREVLVDEVEVGSDARAWRTDGGHRFGIAINDAGRAAIGIEPAPPASTAAPIEPARATITTSKIGSVLQLLNRAEGATLDEMVQATGWLPHTTRAALTGLRKKGHIVDKGKRGEITCYRVAAA